MKSIIKFIFIVTIFIVLSISIACKSTDTTLETKNSDISNKATSSNEVAINSITSAPNKDSSFATPTLSLVPTMPIRLTESTKQNVALLKPQVLPILYYHAVSNNINGMDELFVSPENFRKQLEYLKINKYDVITFDDLPSLDKFKKPVIITFDDGYENNYLEAYPILKEFSFKAVIFLTTNFIDKDKFIKTNQIKSSTDIFKFEGHTVSHSDLTKLSTDKLEYELGESKNIIQNMTGQEITAFAYPTGFYNSEIIKTVKEYYSYAVTNQSGLFDTKKDLFQIKRVYIPRNTTILNFEKRLKNGSL